MLDRNSCTGNNNYCVPITTLMSLIHTTELAPWSILSFCISRCHLPKPERLGDLSTKNSFEGLFHPLKRYRLWMFVYPSLLLAVIANSLYDRLCCKTFCIFRGKIDPATGKDLTTLPKRTHEVITVTFTAQEQTIYEQVTRKSFNSIFAKMMRLGQGVSCIPLV